MLTDLHGDNQQLTRYVRSAHNICEEYHDVATTSLIEVWIDQSDRGRGFSRKLSAIFRDVPVPPCCEHVDFF